MLIETDRDVARSMPFASSRGTAPPVADIKSLHRELEQIFAGTQNGSRETKEEADDNSAATCLVIKGK